MIVNSMCIDCARYGRSCEGTECRTWTGCVRRETETERDARVFNAYRKELLRLASDSGTLRFNVIEYDCSFPGIDPAKMAAVLIGDGVNIMFDDSSISERENASKRAYVARIATQVPREVGRRND